MVETGADRRPDSGISHRLGPPDEQVVEVEHALRLLLGDIGREQAAERLLVVAAPREAFADDAGERPSRVDRARVDREARSFLREAPRAAREAEPLAQQVEQVLGVGPVVDRERRIEPDLRRDAAQQARADAVEGAAPGQARRVLQRREAERFVQHATDAPLHLERGAARERQQQQARRIGAGDDEASDARRERQRLA